MDKQGEQENKIWALVPAAGIGARMAADRPKQYLSVAGKTILEHTLSALLNSDRISGVQLCLSSDDQYWPQICLDHQRLLPVVDGGAERADSVLAGLQALSSRAESNDWVLVHDAARPCLSKQLIDQLIEAIGDHHVGGILAVPLVDTIKYSKGLLIEKTVDRKQLWAGQTPQMFRYGMLRDCLKKALLSDVAITDESSALEVAGYQPLIVPSVRSNIKVTYPEDLEWVAHFLSSD